jgi:hypothetical protein
MPRPFLPLVLLASMFCAGALADVEVHAVQHKALGPVLAARVSGEIVPGDYEALMKGLKAHPGRFAKKLLLLDSIGGSVPEAIRMGRLLRETGFDALVPEEGVCQGTCVYLLAAGKMRTVRGAVGLHRPYFPAGDSARASSTASRYSPAAYFKDMDVAPGLLGTMNGIAPQQMRVLSAQELAQYRLN